MAVPARPTSGAPIDSTWGGVAHDTAVAQDIQTGSATVNVSAATSAQLVIVFPRPFASPPTVMVNIASANRLWNVGAAAVTAVQFVATVGNVDNAATTNGVSITWFAYGPRA